MPKQRADILMVEQGLAPTRTRAQALILAGAVMRGPDRRVDKPGDFLDETTELWLRDQPLPYVSRGGLKLAGALDAFGLSPAGAICLDIGASTGGFTDVLLQRGAAKVYAVDVGYGQLAFRLRQDARVVVIERANIRTMAAELIPEPCAFVVVDVSFISLRLVIPAALRFLTPDATLVALVKPQFEVGRQEVGKGGIVRDPAARAAALAAIVAACPEWGFSSVRTMDSPIVGAKGNHEFLLAATRTGASLLSSAGP